MRPRLDVGFGRATLSSMRLLATCALILAAPAALAQSCPAAPDHSAALAGLIRPMVVEWLEQNAPRQVSEALARQESEDD